MWHCGYEYTNVRYIVLLCSMCVVMYTYRLYIFCKGITLVELISVDYV